MGKIISNKHYSEPSAITLSKFSETPYKFGEIIVCNSAENPGLYILTDGAQESAVINATSGEYIKLKGFVVPDGDIAQIHLSEDDTVSAALGKVVRLIQDARDNAMPPLGGGLSDENGVLSVLVDNTTIKLTPDGKLYSVGGGGSQGGGGTYIPGAYIAIDGDNVISVTGITPDSYATKAELADYAKKSEIEETYAKKSELNGLATTSDVEAGVQEAKDYANDNFATTAFVETYVEEHAGGGADPAAINAEKERAMAAEAELQEGINQLSGTVSDLADDVDERFDEVIEIATATTQAIETLNGRVDENESDIEELKQTVAGLDPSSMTLISTNVLTSAEPFEVDGVEYEAGTYLVMTFGVEGDESTYKTSYSNISPIISAGKEYMTEAQYNTLVEEGEVTIDGRTVVFDPNVDYYTFED